MTADVHITAIGSQANVLEIAIRGFLDTMAAYALQERIHAQIIAGHHRYVINLEALEQISSAGIGFFFRPRHGVAPASGPGGVYPLARTRAPFVPHHAPAGTIHRLRRHGIGPGRAGH
jgi:hypothetical protein